jgi:hypothetical protein
MPPSPRVPGLGAAGWWRPLTGNAGKCAGGAKQRRAVRCPVFCRRDDGQRFLNLSTPDNRSSQAADSRVALSGIDFVATFANCAQRCGEITRTVGDQVAV